MHVAELEIIAGSGIAGPLQEIAAGFARSANCELAIRFGTTPELIKMATTGRAFDLGVVPQDVVKDATARARFAPGPIPDVARVGIGVAVRAGAPRPDISTPEALKQTLLAAGAIASIPASATGTQLASIYQRLGIAEPMAAKTRAQAGPRQIADAVANGEAELAVFLLNVLADPRLDLVGPLPSQVQREIVYAAGVAAESRQPQAARAFIAHLIGPAAAAVIKANGMVPG